MTTTGKNKISRDSLPLSKNGLKETRYLVMKLRKELDTMAKKCYSKPNNTKRSMFIVKIRTTIPPILKRSRVLLKGKKY